MAGYLFSNKKLRDDLGKAKDAEEAAVILGKHLQKDGKKFAGQVREFVESDEVQKEREDSEEIRNQEGKRGNGRDQKIRFSRVNKSEEDREDCCKEGGKKSEGCRKKGRKEGKDCSNICPESTEKIYTSYCDQNTETLISIAVT